MPNRAQVVVHILRTLDEFGGTPHKLLMQVSNGSVHKHVVICTSEKGGLAPSFEKIGIPVYELRSSFYGFLLSIYRVIRILSEEGATLIHAHFFRSRVIAKVAGLIAGVRVVYSEHGAVPELRRWVVAMDRILMPSRSVVICNSNATKRQFSLERPWLRDLRVIYNGVPEPKLPESKTRRSAGGGCLSLVAVGGIIPSRNYSSLLRNVRAALDAGISVKLDIFGDGPLRDEVLAAIAGLSLEEVVFMRGYMSRQEVLAAVSRADVYVSASSNEGFGIAAVEAMLMKKPVLLVKSGAHAELLPSELSFQYFSLGEHETFLSMLHRYAQCPDELEAVGVLNYEHAITKFSVSRFVRELDSVYSEFGA